MLLCFSKNSSKGPRKRCLEEVYEGRRHFSQGTYPEPGYHKELVKLSFFSDLCTLWSVKVSLPLPVFVAVFPSNMSFFLFGSIN